MKELRPVIKVNPRFFFMVAVLFSFGTSDLLQAMPAPLPDSISFTYDGESRLVLFDGSLDDENLYADAYEFALRLNLKSGGTCSEDVECVARSIVSEMRGTINRRHLVTGRSLDSRGLRLLQSDRGYDYLVRSTDTLVGPALNRGGYEEPLLSVMLALLEFGDDVIDAGANLGAHSTPLAHHVAGRCDDSRRRSSVLPGLVHSIEPQAMLHSLLNANVALNGDGCLVAAVRSIHAAAGSKTGQMIVPILNFGAAQNFAQLSLGGQPLSGGIKDTVSLVTVDNITKDSFNLHGPVHSQPEHDGVKIRCPSLIKIDVEGMEHDVLSGAHETISHCRPILVVENNDHPSTGLAVRHCRKDLGYVAFTFVFHYFDELRVGQHETDTFTPPSKNILCAPKSKVNKLVNFTKYLEEVLL